MKVHLSRISPTGAINFTLTADNESDRSVLECLTAGTMWPRFRIGGCSYECDVGATKLILQQEERTIADSGHDERDAYVMSRAQNGADAPYNQDTCRRYPWAAAARIKFLESIVTTIKGA